MKNQRRAAVEHRTPAPVSPGPDQSDESGKIGKAFVMWLLGVPGGLILIYLLFSSC